MITHVYSYYEDPSSSYRNQLARRTWAETYKKGGWLPLPVLDQTLPRLFSEGNRKLPYIKDLLSEALTTPGDYICLTNADICFSPRLHARLAEVRAEDKMIFCHRRDFMHEVKDPMEHEEIITGIDYPGMDLFMFPKSWWRDVSAGFPDVLLGREGWDAVMHLLMLWAGSYDERDLIYHQWHNSFWEQHHNRYRLGGQVHNIWRVGNWMRQHNVDLGWYNIREIPIPQEPQCSTDVTPPGGWHVEWNGLSEKHYSFDLCYKRMKEKLEKAGNEVPNNLKSLIKQQTCGCL